MKRILFTFFCVTAVCLAVSAQGKSPNKHKLHYPDSEGVDVYHRFPGGHAAFDAFIKKNLIWPTGPKREGKVLVEFTVGKSGKLSAFKLNKSLANEYDKEALRVIKNSPPWIPGRKLLAKRSIPASYRMTLPIVFSLN